MFRVKNYLNRPMFHGVIQKVTLAHFFETRCTLYCYYYYYLLRLLLFKSYAKYSIDRKKTDKLEGKKHSIGSEAAIH